MNYKLEITNEGHRWIKQTWNEETQQIVNEPLPINQSLTLDPRDFIGDSSIFLFKDSPSEIMKHEDGSAYTLEDLMNEVLAKNSKTDFKPIAWYNAPGDLLEIYWKSDCSVVHWLGDGIELCKNSVQEIVGAKVWGLKRLLLEAYANCEQPKKMVAIEALNPKTSSSSENMD